MTIVFDVTHPAHINLFKSAIKILEEKGHDVIITALNRGKLPDILKAELPGKNISVIGEYPESSWGVLWESNLKRMIKLLRFLKEYDPDILVGSESISVLLAARMLGKPSLLFSDDPERPVATFLKLGLATRVYYPILDFDFRWFKSKVVFYNALKQWAYLSPSHFKPNDEVLSIYNLEKKKYIFVRDVSTTSINYKDQKADSLTKVAHEFPNEYEVLLSLENKKVRELFPDSWIILQEPVTDIHSLMYYSKAIVSTGDSMVREGAMMGVPSLYSGVRDMSANKVMKDRGLLFQVEPNELPSKLKKIQTNSFNIPDQEESVKKLDEEWIDLTNLIIKKIEEHARN